MIHDQDLLDQLCDLPQEIFDGQVFRVTPVAADALAPSINGGRWAPKSDGDPGVFVLYTSLERDGALAEVCSYLAQQTPIPKPRPLKVTRLRVKTSQTVRLLLGDLAALRVDMARYGERDYSVTQRIGAALAFLGVNGLTAIIRGFTQNYSVI